MKYIVIILFCVLGASLSACSASKKRKQVQDDVEQPEPPPPVAPGTARVSLEILEVEETASGYQCAVKILGVDAYGAGTPPLPVGSEISVLVSHEVAANSEAAKTGNAFLASGMTTEMTLLHREAPRMPGVTLPPWRATQVP